jgi:hypothetical protein
VLIEQDKVPSLIRIIDTYTMEVPPPGQSPPVRIAVDIKFFVAVKSGGLKGEFEIGLTLRNPAGIKTERLKWPVVFTGVPEQGAQITVNLDLLGEKPGVPPLPGVYWFEVLWGEEEVLTSTPFRLKHALPKVPPTG